KKVCNRLAPTTTNCNPEGRSERQLGAVVEVGGRGNAGEQRRERSNTKSVGRSVTNSRRSVQKSRDVSGARVLKRLRGPRSCVGFFHAFLL
ncbi:hypothetical protein JG687_00014408, partial [Phytophthora cactorum]